MSTKVEPILEVEDLHVLFPIRSGLWGRHVGDVHAVSGVSLKLYKGETLGLVGESGCGKSTTGRAILQLTRPSEGRIILNSDQGSVDLAALSDKALLPYRRRVQMIFQDPYASLNPRMTVGDIVAEPIRVHKLRPSDQIMARVQEVMELCGLNPRFVRRYPHEFSGGQRQRIGIARALAAEPQVVVADEPISALDVSIQAQILNLMSDLQRDLGLTFLFIAHDLAAVRHISDRIAVMYLGALAETAPARALYREPLHPYTRALISAVPIPDPRIERTRERIVLSGDLPSPADPPSGCRFSTRCPFAWERCRAERPVLRPVAEGREVACHLFDPNERERRQAAGLGEDKLYAEAGATAEAPTEE